MIHTPQWQALLAHRSRMSGAHMHDLFVADPQRAERFSVSAGPLFIDYAKHRITPATVDLLLRFAAARDVEGWRTRMLDAHAINATEGRSAQHMALRGSGSAGATAHAQATLGAMRRIANAVREGRWTGATGRPITDVIHIGIGGSDLGPRLAVAALAPRGALPRVHFVANVDPHELDDALHGCEPASTLVIVISKSFGTAETLLNAEHARLWLAGALGQDLTRHLIAVTGNTEAARAFGVAAEGILPMPDWVGGRFSLWSAVGLSIMIALGEAAFDELLAGAAELDAHFIGSPLAANAPVLLALLSIWYVNFWGAQSHAVLPYARRLDLLPDYLQQLEMESNGKRIDREGAVVTYATAPVIFGNVGANSQHSFHQMLHQGTHLVPSDFIVTVPGDDARSRMLAGSAMAQTAALMRGDRAEPDALPGNQPSTTILMPQVDPRTLGALLSLYEHKVFVEGILWNINSFDQPGVELGKRIATHLAPALAGGAVPKDADASTRALAARLAGK